jgi:uncharacterized membrane protein YphA (DoxX/SURF4 family)
MRTNPFVDTWMFLIGSTDDHNALGVFKYAFVVLFLLLLAASAWIAVTNWREDPGQRTASHLSIFVCRVLIGSMWFQGCLWKLPLPVSGGFQHWLGQMVDNAAFEFHRTLVKNVFVPYIQFLDPMVFLAEISFATSLLLGFGVRLFAFVAIFFALHLWLGLYLHPAEWPWNYMFLAIVHALFVLCAAGRSLGLDAWLRRNVPAVRERTVWWGRLLGAIG